MAKSYEPDDLANRTYIITMIGTAVYIAAVVLFVYN